MYAPLVVTSDRNANLVGEGAAQYRLSLDSNGRGVATQYFGNNGVINNTDGLGLNLIEIQGYRPDANGVEQNGVVGTTTFFGKEFLFDQNENLSYLPGDETRIVKMALGNNGYITTEHEYVNGDTGQKVGLMWNEHGEVIKNGQLTLINPDKNISVIDSNGNKLNLPLTMDGNIQHIGNFNRLDVQGEVPIPEETQQGIKLSAPGTDAGHGAGEFPNMLERVLGTSDIRSLKGDLQFNLSPNVQMVDQQTTGWFGNSMIDLHGTPLHGVIDNGPDKIGTIVFSSEGQIKGLDGLVHKNEWVSFDDNQNAQNGTGWTAKKLEGGQQIAWGFTYTDQNGKAMFVQNVDQVDFTNGKLTFTNPELKQDANGKWYSPLLGMDSQGNTFNARLVPGNITVSGKDQTVNMSNINGAFRLDLTSSRMPLGQPYLGWAAIFNNPATSTSNANASPSGYVFHAAANHLQSLDGYNASSEVGVIQFNLNPKSSLDFGATQWYGDTALYTLGKLTGTINNPSQEQVGIRTIEGVNGNHLFKFDTNQNLEMFDGNGQSVTTRDWIDPTMMQSIRSVAKDQVYGAENLDNTHSNATEQVREGLAEMGAALNNPNGPDNVAFNDAYKKFVDFKNSIPVYELAAANKGGFLNLGQGWTEFYGTKGNWGDIGNFLSRGTHTIGAGLDFVYGMGVGAYGQVSGNWTPYNLAMSKFNRNMAEGIAALAPSDMYYNAVRANSELLIGEDGGYKAIDISNANPYQWQMEQYGGQFNMATDKEGDFSTVDRRWWALMEVAPALKSAFGSQGVDQLMSGDAEWSQELKASSDWKAKTAGQLLGIGQMATEVLIFGKFNNMTGLFGASAAEGTIAATARAGVEGAAETGTRVGMAEAAGAAVGETLMRVPVLGEGGLLTLAKNGSEVLSGVLKLSPEASSTMLGLGVTAALGGGPIGAGVNMANNGVSLSNFGTGYAGGALATVGAYSVAAGPSSQIALAGREGMSLYSAVAANSALSTAGMLTLANGGSLLLNQHFLTREQNLALGTITFGTSLFAGVLTTRIAQAKEELNIAAKAYDKALKSENGGLEEFGALQEAREKLTDLESTGSGIAAKMISSGIGMGNSMMAINNVMDEPNIRDNPNASIGAWRLSAGSFIGWDFAPDDKDQNENLKNPKAPELKSGGFDPVFGFVGGMALAGFGMGGEALAEKAALNKTYAKYITMATGAAAVNVARGYIVNKYFDHGSLSDYIKNKSWKDAGVGLLVGLGGAGIKQGITSLNLIEGTNPWSWESTWKGKLFDVGVYTGSSLIGGKVAREAGRENYGNFKDYAPLIDLGIGAGAGWMTASSVKWANSIAFGKSAQMGGANGGRLQRIMGSSYSPFYSYSAELTGKAAKAGIEAIPEAIDSDGSLMLGQYLSNVATAGTVGRVALASGAGVFAGDLAYWADPNKGKQGHTLDEYLNFGQNAGALLGLLAIARPALGLWSREDSTISLRNMATRPDLAVKMSIATALDFGAMMPAWKLIQAPGDVLIKTAAHYTGRLVGAGSPDDFSAVWEKSREEAYSDVDVSQAGFNKTVTDGFSMGYKLGPYNGRFH